VSLTIVRVGFSAQVSTGLRGEGATTLADARQAPFRDGVDLACEKLHQSRAARGEFDVVHSHLDFLAFGSAELVSAPTVTTLHGRLDLPDLRRIYARFPDAPVISISNHQRRPIPDANWAATVYNGVDTDRLAFNPTGGTYLAWLGRISPDKGLDRAIDIARLAGMTLKVAARLPLNNRSNPEIRGDWAYYETVVKPLLAEGDVEFVGEVRDGDKTDFLGNAIALLNPIDWPEPFGLVMAEALSCGTPVVARRRGSVPELVSHGLTGLIGETDEELAQLCREVGAIKRSLCRQEAVWRFSVEEMTLGYERAYDAVIARAGLVRSPAYGGETETLVVDLEPGV